MQPVPRRQALIAAPTLIAAAAVTGLSAAIISAVAIAVLAGLVVLLVADEYRLEREHRALTARNAALERASDTKTRLVANLAHELRNPLGAVIGYSELMDSGRFGTLDERQCEHIGVIRDSGQHMLSLIEELLDMARIEAGHLRLEAAPVDPSAVVRGCAAALQTIAERHAVTVALDTPPTDGLVLLDPTRLRQVVLNFLSNAIKFSPQDGTVHIALRHERGGIRIEVSDAGPGLAPADQRDVFDEFFQVPGGARSGTGLGLAVTRLIVEAQGGRVGVASQLGVGSTFWAWLPATAADTVGELARPPLSLSVDGPVPRVAPTTGASAIGV